MPLFPNHGFQKPDLRVFEFLNRQLTVQERYQHTCGCLMLENKALITIVLLI